MSRSFTSRPLNAELALKAYPLVRVIRADLSLDDWTDYVNRHADAVSGGANARGIVALMNHLEYLNGIFSYEVRPEPYRDPVLHVRDVVVLDILKRCRAAEALERAMVETAARHRCAAIRTAVDQDDPWLKDYFREERFDSQRMCRHRSPDRIGAPG